MINVDFESEVKHTFTFDADQLKDILIEALRITGVDIPDCPDIEVDESPDFEVKMSFTQDDLESYQIDKAEAAAEPEDWSTDDAPEVDGTCKGCPAEEK